MDISYFKPSSFLNKYIERYWAWEHVGSEIITLPPIIPGTGVELFFHYHTPLVVCNGNGLERQLANNHIVCARSKHHKLRETEKIAFIAARFRVGTFRHFINLSMSEIGDTFLSAEEIWGKRVSKLEEDLINATSMKARVGLLDGWLFELYSLNYKTDTDMDYVANKIYYGYKDLRINSLAEELGISKRHLERKFIASIGVSPKALQMNSRFVSVLKHLLLHRKKDYLSYAMDEGYYDQSHFIKDFNYYVGESPTLFLQEKNFRSHFYNKSITPVAKIMSIDGKKFC